MGIPKNWDRRDQTRPFNFIIDLVNEDDSIIQIVAGAENVYVARAAFREIPRHYQPHETLRLRQGGRIMDRVKGTGEEYLRYMEAQRGGRP